MCCVLRNSLEASFMSFSASLTDFMVCVVGVLCASAERVCVWQIAGRWISVGRQPANTSLSALFTAARSDTLSRSLSLSLMASHQRPPVR